MAFFCTGESGGKTQAVTLLSKTSGTWSRYTLDGTVPTRKRGYVYCGVIHVPGRQYAQSHRLQERHGRKRRHRNKSWQGDEIGGASHEFGPMP